MKSKVEDTRLHLFGKTRPVWYPEPACRQTGGQKLQPA
jgi:hypothetical protein